MGKGEGGEGVQKVLQVTAAAAGDFPSGPSINDVYLMNVDAQQ